MRKQPLTDAEYVATLGTKCPSCQSTQVEGGSVNIDGSTAAQDVHCNACGASWNDVYALIGYTYLET